MVKGDPMHFKVPGYFGTAGIPACGAWSRDLTSKPEDVRCDDCRATLDYAMAANEKENK